MKKILHFVDANDIEAPGGIETVVRNIVAELETSYSHSLALKVDISRSSLAGNAIASRELVENLLSKHLPDAVHLHGSSPLIWTSIRQLKKLFQGKIFVTTFWHKPATAKRPLMAFANFLALRFVLAEGVDIHFCTEYERRFFSNVNKVRTRVFPPLFIAESEESESVRHGYLFVSRNDAHKGFGIFLDVARRLPNERFFAVVDELKCEEIPANVRIFQQISKVELDRLFRTSKALVFPSAYESFGGVLVEALSLGAMVICSERVLAVEYFSNNDNVIQYEYGTHEKNVSRILTAIECIDQTERSFFHYASGDANFNGLSRDFGRENMLKFYGDLSS